MTSPLELSDLCYNALCQSIPKWDLTQFKKIRRANTYLHQLNANQLEKLYKRFFHAKLNKTYSINYYVIFMHQKKEKLTLDITEEIFNIFKFLALGSNPQCPQPFECLKELELCGQMKLSLTRNITKFLPNLQSVATSDQVTLDRNFIYFLSSLRLKQFIYPTMENWKKNVEILCGPVSIAKQHLEILYLEIDEDYEICANIMQSMPNLKEFSPGYHHRIGSLLTKAIDEGHGFEQLKLKSLHVNSDFKFDSDVLSMICPNVESIGFRNQLITDNILDWLDQFRWLTTLTIYDNANFKTLNPYQVLLQRNEPYIFHNIVCLKFVMFKPSFCKSSLFRMIEICPNLETLQLNVDDFENEWVHHFGEEFFQEISQLIFEMEVKNIVIIDAWALTRKCVELLLDVPSVVRCEIIFDEWMGFKEVILPFVSLKDEAARKKKVLECKIIYKYENNRFVGKFLHDSRDVFF